MPQQVILISELSLFSLLWAAWQKNKGLPIKGIYYDRLALLFRVWVYGDGIFEKKLIAALSFITSIPISRMPNGSLIKEYEEIYLQCLRATTEVSFAAQSRFSHPLLKPVNDFLGQQAQLAYASKWFARRAFRLLLLLHSVASYEGAHIQLVLFNPLLAFELWGKNKAIRMNSNHPIIVHDSSASWVVQKTWLLLCVLGLLVRSFVCFSRYKINKKEFDFLIELYDPHFTEGTPQDVDGWIDGKHISKKDVALFLTKEQEKYLRQKDIQKKWIEGKCKKNGYFLIRLKALPHVWQDSKKIGTMVARCIKEAFLCQDKMLLVFFLHICQEIWSLSPLFSHAAAKKLIKVNIPNGTVGLQYNDGVMTGLARKQGMVSVGYQTRIIYCSKYEYYFDCFDEYLSWGPGWHESFDGINQFLGKIHFIGCPLQVPAEKNKERMHKPRSNKKPKDVQVILFPTDIDDSQSHYTRSYFEKFLKGCSLLAAQFPECRFQIKLKDPGHENIYAQSPYAHFKVVGAVRYDYGDILQTSDVVIAIGYTTPGFEAILLGKPTLFYAPTHQGGESFQKVDGLVCRQYEQLERNFGNIIKDKERWLKGQQSSLLGLDPFLDKKAIARGIKALRGEPL